MNKRSKLTLNSIARELSSIVRIIEKRGGLVVLTGGTVRDILLDRDSNFDIDFEVFYLSVDELETILEPFNFIKVGKQFGVYKIKGGLIDITLPRSDIKSGVHHRDFEISFRYYASFREAAERRDLTINSLGYLFHNGLILGNSSFIDDLVEGVLKPTNSTCFKEDELRILRVAQLASRLEMKVHEQIEHAWGGNTINFLSLERIQAELVKLLTSSRPSFGMRFLVRQKLVPFFIEDNEIEKLDTTKDYEVRLFIVVFNALKHSENNVGLVEKICYLFGRKSLGNKLYKVAKFFQQALKVEKKDYFFYQMYIVAKQIYYEIAKVYMFKEKKNFLVLDKVINGKLLKYVQIPETMVTRFFNIVREELCNSYEPLCLKNVSETIIKICLRENFNLDENGLIHQINQALLC